MARLISKIPPVSLVGFRTVTDMFGKKWTCAIVNPMIGSQYGIIAYRADKPGPFPLSIDARNDYTRTRWFKCNAGDFLSVLAALERSNANPEKLEGWLSPKLRVGNFLLSKISIPSWGVQVLRTLP